MIFIFLCLTSLNVIISRSIHVAANDIVSLFFIANTPHHYPLLCWWTFSLLPQLIYCKQCFSKHWGACMVSSYSFLLFSWSLLKTPVSKCHSSVFLKCSLWISAIHLYSMLKSFIFSPEVGLFWHEEIFRSLLFKPEHGHNAQPWSLVNTCQVSVHASPLRIQRMNEKLGMCL